MRRWSEYTPVEKNRDKKHEFHPMETTQWNFGGSVSLKSWVKTCCIIKKEKYDTVFIVKNETSTCPILEKFVLFELRGFSMWRESS